MKSSLALFCLAEQKVAVGRPNLLRCLNKDNSYFNIELLTIRLMSRFSHQVYGHHASPSPSNVPYDDTQYRAVHLAVSGFARMSAVRLFKS